MGDLAMNGKEGQMAGGKVRKPARFPCAAESGTEGGIERGDAPSQVEV
jgi:hypothetical protein